MAWFGRSQRRLQRRPPVTFRRAALAVVAFGASVLFLGAIAGGLLLLRLSTGPIDVNIAAQIAAALNGRVAGQYVFALGSTAIEQSDHGPQLTIDHFNLTNGRGRIILTAPRASVSVDPLQLLIGRISPKRIEVQDVTLRVLRLEDGSIGVAAGTDQSDAITLGSLASNLSPAGPGGGSDTVGRISDPPVSAVPVQWNLPDVLAGTVGRLVDHMFDTGGPLHAVDRIGLRRGTLIVDDRLRHAATTYHDLTVDVDRETTGGIFATIGASGPSGRLSLASRVVRRSDGVKSLDLAVDHLSTDELMMAGGLRKSFFESDMLLSFSLNAEVGPDGKLRRAGGPVAFSGGYFKFDDPDHEPVLVDRIDTTLKVSPDTGTVDFGAGTFAAGPTTYSFGVSFAPPGAGGKAWTIDGKAAGSFGPERPGEAPIKLDNVGFHMSLDPAAGRLAVENVVVKGPEADFKLTAAIEVNDPGFKVTTDIKVGRMPAQALLRLWPSFIGAPPRAWLLANVKDGTLDSGSGHVVITDADIEAMRRQRSVPDDHVRVDFKFSNATLGFMTGLPPLRGLDATGVLTGDTFTLTVPKAEMELSPGRKLAASEGVFVIPSMDPKPTPTEIRLRVAGGVEAAAELLSRDALKPYADLPIDAGSVSGQVDGRLVINLKLGDRVSPDDVKVKVDATTRDFSVAKVLGKEPLTDATLTISADRSRLSAKGEGRIFGAATTIDLRKAAGGAASEAQVSLVLDDAARQKAGFSFGRALSGPVPVKINTSFTPGEKSRAQVEVDLTRAVLESPLPGLRKAAGRPSKASFVATQDNGRTSFDQIVFENGSTAVRGSAGLDGNGALATASFTQLRLSPGDDAKAELSRTSDGFKVVVRGANIDARPFFKTAMSGDSGANGDAMVRDLDLDLHANLLTGENAQALSDVDMKMVRRGGQLRRVQMSGKQGRAPFTVTTTGSGQNAVIVIASRDAGATLAFLDLYKRMDGGRLDTTLRFVNGRIDGVTTIHQFTIKEDPTIRKLADEQIPSNSRNAGARIDPSVVSFSKLEATFSKTGNRVEVRQGSMFGPNVGATVEGTIDFAHDKVALSGTFVPIYGLNNLFSQIPVVGLLLGGGTHEGLFALNYHITGPASAPVLTFNPLSALAPGILRKIFGAIDDAAQQSFDQVDGHDRSQAPGALPGLPE